MLPDFHQFHHKPSTHLFLHFKIHEIFSRNLPNLQCYCKIRVKHDEKHTSEIGLHESLTINESFLFKLDKADIQNETIEISLIQHHGLLKAQTKQLAQFTCQLQFIFNYDPVHNGFVAKWLVMKPEHVYLKASGFISTSDHFVTGDCVSKEDNDGWDEPRNLIFCTNDVLSKTYLSCLKIKTYYIDLFNVDVDTTTPVEEQRGVECQLMFYLPQNDSVFKRKKIKLGKWSNKMGKLVELNEEFVVNLNLSMKYVEKVKTKFVILISGLKLRTHLEFTEFVQVSLNEENRCRIGPMLKDVLTSDGAVVGHILIELEFAYKRTRQTEVISKCPTLDSVHRNRVSSVGLHEKYSKKCEFIFMFVPFEVFWLPIGISALLSVQCRVLTKHYTKTLPFCLTQNDSYGHFKWSDSKPLVIVKFNWLDQLQRIQLTNSIDELVLGVCSLDEFKLNIDSSLTETKQIIQLIEACQNENVLFDKLRHFQETQLCVNMPDIVIEVVEWSLLPSSSILCSFNLKPNTILYRNGRLADRVVSYTCQSSLKTVGQIKPVLIGKAILFPSMEQLNAYCDSKRNILSAQLEKWMNRNNMFGKWLKPNGLFHVPEVSDHYGKRLDNDLRVGWSDGSLKDSVIKEPEFEYEIQIKQNSKFRLFPWTNDKTTIWHTINGRFDCDLWHTDTAEWQYANNLKQTVWLTSDFYLNYRYRRRKLFKKVSSQTVYTNRDVWFYAKYFDSRFFNGKFLNSFCRTRRFVKALNVTTASDLVNGENVRAFIDCSRSYYTIEMTIWFSEILSTENVLWLMSKKVKSIGSDQTNSSMFFTLKIKVFDVVRVLVNQNISETVDFLAVNSNPTWNQNTIICVNLALDEYQLGSDVPISLECDFYYQNSEISIEANIGSALVYASKTTTGLVKLHKMDQDVSALLLANFKITKTGSPQNGPIIEHITPVYDLKKIYVFSLGFRFNDSFVKSLAKNQRKRVYDLLTTNNRRIQSRNLEMICVCNSQIQATKLQVTKNYGLNDHIDCVTFSNVKYYGEYKLILSPLDIYLSIGSSQLVNVLAVCRIASLQPSEWLQSVKKTDKLDKDGGDWNKKKKQSKEYLMKIQKQSGLSPNQSLWNDNDENDVDFWTRYGESLKGHSETKHALCYLDTLPVELEQVYDLNSEMNCHSVWNSDKSEVIGEFRSKIYMKSEDLVDELALKPLHTLPCHCLVRLYIIKAFDLVGRTTATGHLTANPYLEIECKGCLDENKILKSDREALIYDCLNPELGRLFEFEVQLPVNQQIEIRLMDFHLLTGSSELIGSTRIDLETRLLSSKHATHGLPRLFFDSHQKIHTNSATADFIEKNLKTFLLLKWRGVTRPSGILRSMCQCKGISCVIDKDAHLAVVDDETIRLNDFQIEHLNDLYTYTTDTFEQFCLNVLHTRFDLIKEHVETRRLYNSTGNQTGTVHLWLDIFPLLSTNDTLPEAVNIEKRKPEQFELRCVVWDVGLYSGDYQAFNEERNICVKSWLAGHESHAQKTDTHYKCVHKASFNYRFLYHFAYLWQEKCLVKHQAGIEENFKQLKKLLKKSKGFLLQHPHEDMKLLPNFYVDVCNLDLLGIEKDVLGSVEINLGDMLEPLKAEPKRGDTIHRQNRLNLFKSGSVDGWWVCTPNPKTPTITCYLRMSMEILTVDKAKSKPTAKGRSSPNLNPVLNEPDREPLFKTSALNPFNRVLTFMTHSFHNRKYLTRKQFAYLILLIFLLLCFWALPAAFINRLVTRIF